MKNFGLKRSVFLLFLFLFLFLAIPVLAAETVVYATDDGGSTATLTLFSRPLLSMTPTDIFLTFDKAHGDSLLSTAAICDLTMPAMPMPENRPVLDCSATGCRGNLIFTMGGGWDIRCDVTFSGSESSNFLFVIDMVQMK